MRGAIFHARIRRSKTESTASSSTRLDALGLTMRPIAEALPAVLREYAKALGKQTIR